MRWIVAVGLVIGLATGPAAVAPDLHAGWADAGPQGPGGCPGQAAPPDPPAAEELAGPPVAPLPVPAQPVGGVGVCGDLVAGGGTVPPEVGVASFVVADLDTGAVLALRAPHARHRPASTIKVVTALVALRELDPGLLVDGTADDLRIDGSRAGIGPGGRYTVAQLLAGMLLNSGNDAAAALARALGGDAATVAAMTATAAGLGALDTRAATPSGLDGPGGVSSAFDLALLFRVALRDPRFAQTITTRSVAFPGYGERPGFELSNSSRFLTGYPGALGGKTGFTDAARHTFVGAAQRDGRRLLVAMMRGEQAPVPMTVQAAALLDLGFALPAGVAPLGTLTDAAPAPEPLPAPEPGPEPEPPDRPADPAPYLLIGLGFAAALLGVGLLRIRR
ncbi:D-alanyl-D-alanine carboxypeptidase family protein [Pseudonocardia saturnea]